MDFNIDFENTLMGSLFHQILSDMKNVSPLWEDFVAKATRLHTCLRAVVHAISSYLDAFQKIADAATKSRGASKDIGTALTRICLRHKAVENRMKLFTSAIMDCLIIPLQGKLEDWKRHITVIDKEHAKEYKKRHLELKKFSSDTLRLKKRARKDQSNSMQSLVNTHMHDISLKHAELEDVERKSLRIAIVEERTRYCTFVDMLQPVVKEECEILYELGHLQEAMQSIASIVKDPNILPSSAEQLISQFKSSLSLSGDLPVTDCTNSLGSRKSSACSIHSANSSESSESPSAQYHNQNSVSQFATTTNTLIPTDSSDSGFCSSPVLLKQLSETAQGMSTWPPHSQDDLPAIDRPHTISTAYEKGHQRPQLTVYTFEHPEKSVELRKSSTSGSCKPPLPIRCSSLERSQISTANLNTTSNFMNRQCPSPIPTYITKDFSQNHQPTYVNTEELNSMGAFLYSNHRSQPQSLNKQHPNSPNQSIASSHMSSESLTTFSTTSTATMGSGTLFSNIDSPPVSGGIQSLPAQEANHFKQVQRIEEVENSTTPSTIRDELKIIEGGTIAITDILPQESDDICRASVQEKASMFEKLEMKKVGFTGLSISTNRSSSIVNLETVLLKKDDGSISKPFLSDKSSDQMYEDSVRELNNIIGELDLFNREYDLNSEMNASNTSHQGKKKLMEYSTYKRKECGNNEMIKEQMENRSGFRCINTNKIGDDDRKISELTSAENYYHDILCDGDLRNRENDSTENPCIVMLRCKDTHKVNIAMKNQSDSKIERLSSFKSNLVSKPDFLHLSEPMQRCEEEGIKRNNLEMKHTDRQHVKPSILPRPVSLSEGTPRTTRRVSNNNFKPPPPVRRSSSVTPQSNYSTPNSPNLIQQNVLNLSADNLPPPPPFLLDRIGSDSSTVNVSETIKALTVINHTPASPNTPRRSQTQHYPLQAYHSTNIPSARHSHVTQGRVMSSFRATADCPLGFSKTAGSVLSKSKAEFIHTLNEKLAKQGLSARAFAVRKLINTQALSDPRMCHESLMDQIKRGATLKRNRTVNDRSAPIIN